MTRRNTDIRLDRRRNVVVLRAQSVEFDGMMDLKIFERVVLGDRPFERSRGADDTEAVVVLRPDGDLAGGDRGGDASLKLGQDGEIVVENAPADESLQACRDSLGRQAGDEFRMFIRVCADIASASRRPRFFGIDPPGCLFLAAFLDFRGEPALGIPRLDLAHLADLAVADEFART